MSDSTKELISSEAIWVDAGENQGNWQFNCLEK